MLGAHPVEALHKGVFETCLGITLAVFISIIIQYSNFEVGNLKQFYLFIL